MKNRFLVVLIQEKKNMEKYQAWSRSGKASTWLYWVLGVRTEGWKKDVILKGYFPLWGDLFVPLIIVESRVRLCSTSQAWHGVQTGTSTFIEASNGCLLSHGACPTYQPVPECRYACLPFFLFSYVLTIWTYFSWAQ
jgi:hypothetical protein